MSPKNGPRSARGKSPLPQYRPPNPDVEILCPDCHVVITPDDVEAAVVLEDVFDGRCRKCRGRRLNERLHEPDTHIQDWRLSPVQWKDTEILARERSKWSAPRTGAREYKARRRQLRQQGEALLSDELAAQEAWEFIQEFVGDDE